MFLKYRKADPVLLGVILALLLIGIVMTYSSSAVKGYLYYEDPYHYFKAELMWV
jgi:cell division protein FtsW